MRRSTSQSKTEHQKTHSFTLSHCLIHKHNNHIPLYSDYFIHFAVVKPLIGVDRSSYAHSEVNVSILIGESKHIGADGEYSQVLAQRFDLMSVVDPAEVQHGDREQEEGEQSGKHTAHVPCALPQTHVE